MVTDKRQFTLRLNEENFEKIKYIASVNKRSIAMQIEFLIEQYSNELKFNGTSKPILNSKNKPWSTTTIREICMRALEGVYSGIYYWNRTGRNLRGTGEKWKDEDDWVLIEDAHPAIINNTEWEELKTTMGPIVQKRKNPNARTNRSEDSQYLFSGNNAAGEPMFICMHCGGSINGQPLRLWLLCITCRFYVAFSGSIYGIMIVDENSQDQGIRKGVFLCVVIHMEEIRWKTTEKKKPPPRKRKVKITKKDIKEVMLPDECRRRTARKEGVTWKSRVMGVYR